jgi:GntR family transcriptional regulator
MALTVRNVHDHVVPKIPMNADQIARDLTDRIAAGEYGEPGTQLPTYAALAELYSVSESTVTKVIGLLRERGVVVGVPGRGTFVAEPK